MREQLRNLHEIRPLRSVLEGEEAGNTSLDPLGLVLVRGQLQVKHEVGRVTRG